MSSHHQLLLPSLFLLLSTFALLASKCTSIHIGCDSLLGFKTALVVPSLELPSWRPGPSNCCHWEGVACDPSSGLISELDLHSLGLAGDISPTLFNLTSLKKLNLAFNTFTGPIPNGFDLLINLTSLNLSNAGFSGQIPIGITKLTDLLVLDLSSDPLSVTPNTSLTLLDPDFETLIRDMSSLKELHLDSVPISWPRWCAALANSTPNLSVLTLEGCSITGPFDPSLLKLSHLSEFRLEGNSINCEVPAFFANMSSLSFLHFGYCGLIGTFPSSVFLLKNLTVVDLSKNPMLTGTLPEFADGSRLEALKITETNFSGSLPASIGKLKSMTSLQLWNSNFSGTIPSSIANLTRLTLFDLSVNHFVGSIPAVLPLSISSLNLRGNALTGLIPSSIAKLENLTELDLSINMLSGEIPASLFSPPLLETLQLNQNQLSGQLPEVSTASSMLSVVDLSNNRLQGEIPVSSFRLFTNMSVLTLASNNFSGEVRVSQFSILSNLTSLDLSNNRITLVDDVAGNVSLGFPQFGTLRLASCNLSIVPSFLKYQAQINTLDLSSNNIQGAIPNWIWSSVTDLNLSCNSFTSVQPFQLDFNTTWVYDLDLHSNMLTGLIPVPGIKLITVDYSDNHFSSIPSNISSYLVYTTFFSAANNDLTGGIPPSFCEASFLLVLDLSGNNFTGLIPPCLLEGDNLIAVLNLQKNQLRGSIPRNISQGCQLRALYLNNNHLEGHVPDTFVNCNGLGVLNLGNNHLRGSFPFWLVRIPALRVVVLRSNGFHGPIGLPSGIGNSSFQRLQILDLSSNGLNGSLPSDFFASLRAMMGNSGQNLSVLEYRYMMTSYYQDTVMVTTKGLEQTLVKILSIFNIIDLSNNAFTGEIPEVLGEFQTLNVLNLSQNSFTGQIPSAFGGMTQLESLDLSENHLSGEIPLALASLTFLGVLNLSSNNLTGRIPQTSQFLTFSNSSFQGNGGLCGIPLSKLCGDTTPTATDTDSRGGAPSESDDSYVIGLALSSGIGYGVGIAAVVVFQNRYWKYISHIFPWILGKHRRLGS